ncbi:MAG TPA: HD domain-containing phosphohydrolase [Candidatus Krumholzibacteria bacterium]
MPPKTRIEKLSSPHSGVTVFKITGTLGFHEKAVLERIFAECNRRGLARVLFEVSELESLGGGCARIIRDEASRGRIAIGLVGASRTVLKFLKKEDAPRIVVADDLTDGIPAVVAKVLAFEARASSDDEATETLTESLEDILSLGDGPAEEEDAGAMAEEAADEPADAPRVVAAEHHHSEDRAGAERDEPRPAPSERAWHRTETPASDARSFVSGDRTRASDDRESSRPTPPVPPLSSFPADAPAGDARDLQKRIVQYNTLFSINADFYRLRDRKALLDAFLLTTIAQVGVESAVFLEQNRNYFVPAAMKGIEPGEMRGFALSSAQLRLEKWGAAVDVIAIDKGPFGDDVKAPLLAVGCAYVAPFIVRGDVRGVLLLGRPIRSDLDASSVEFLKILIHQAAIAYESMSRFEEENERTLGVVQTLISLIEENTLARGNTNLITNYTFALAQKMHYPAEHLRDLMYGTVLRDIGMIKVSDLIVRSPRELMPEEWDIIKRHPTDGAAMLRDMRFSDHAVSVVLHHHERFNGEGYPRGTQGQDIPLGARIVSVVESYAAMLQQRPTRPALSREEALITLKENWGMRYDPEVVRCFVEVIEDEIRSGENTGEKKFALFNV